jgi:hypothetical protein
MKAAVILFDRAKLSVVSSGLLELLQPKAAVKVLNNPIALAGGIFETFTVQDLHRPALIFNQSRIFEIGRRQTHARTSRAEHLCEKIVS